MSRGAPPWRARRAADIAALGETRFDLAVIGGGITGAGIAWQAALHGLSTLLVEARDWAGGTSSRSSKLVHGGLRYLPHGEVRLVREVGHERELLEHLWPHLVTPLPFLIPVYRRRTMPLWALGAGVWLYDRLTGVEPPHRRRMLGPADVLALEGELAREDLLGGVHYYEARTDDARLVWAVVGAARAAGAIALSRMRAVSLDLGRQGGSVELVDTETGDRHAVQVRVAVNAAGPWASELDPGGARLVLARGSHLVFPRARLPIAHAVALAAPDQGNTFAVPRGAVTYVGTTDRLFTGDPALPDVPDEDVRYLLDVLALNFPRAALSTRDLLAVYAGVRPLVQRGEGQATRELSRQKSLDVRQDGLISVRGGKLTGFRSVATDVLRQLGRAGLALHAGAPTPAGTSGADAAQLAARYGLDAAAAAELVARHGGDAEAVLTYAAGRPDGLRPVADGAALLWGEVDWAAEREEIFDLSDLLLRRTGFLWFGGVADLDPLVAAVAERIAPLLGWTGPEVRRQVLDCAREAHLPRLHALRGQAVRP